MRTLSYLISIHQQGSEYFAVFPKELAIERFLICVTTASNNATVQFEIHRSDNSTYADAFVVNVLYLDAFTVSENFDTSGSRIVADGNVAVSCMFLLDAGVGIIQSVPVKVLGKRYILVPYEWKTEQQVRIATVIHSTSISKLNTTLRTDCLPRGHILNINVEKGNDWKDITSFHADRPLLVLETLVSIQRTFLLSPVEQYSSYMSARVLMGDLHFLSCIFIHFSPTEPTFNLTIVDLESSNEIIETLTPNTTYSARGEYMSTLAYLQKILNAYGTPQIVSSVDFFGTCRVSLNKGSYLLTPHHFTEFINQECELLQDEVGCHNCSAICKEDCKEEKSKQQTCEDVLLFVLLHPEHTETELPVATVLVKSIAMASVGIIVAGSLLVSAVLTVKYMKRKAVRRHIRPV